MEYIQAAQNILLILLAVVVSFLLIVAMLKGKKIDIEKLASLLTSLLSKLPPIRHEWTDQTKECMEEIKETAVKIEENTRRNRGNNVDATT